jgi:hypothetical protein
MASGQLLVAVEHFVRHFPQSFGGRISIFATADAVQLSHILVFPAFGMAHVFCVAGEAALDLAVAGELFLLRVLEG